MSTDLNVESIVAQIRKRLAEEGTNGWSARKQADSPSARPILHSYRTRMTEDSWRFADLDNQIEGAFAAIGSKPPAPPTWRGRFGAWIIDALRRLLWWYTAPLQQTIQLLAQRNREQAVRHLQLQEQLLSLVEGMQSNSSRIEDVEAQREELEEGRGSQQQLQRRITELDALQVNIRSQLAFITEQLANLDTNQAVEALSRQLNEIRQTHLYMEHRIGHDVAELKQSVQGLRDFAAASESSRSELERRAIELADTVNRLLPADIAIQMERLEQKLRPILETGLRSEREQLSILQAETTGLRSRLEQHTETVHSLAQRLPGLETQLYAEIESREALAARTNQQVEQIEQGLASHLEGISQAVQSLQIRLPVLEEQFRAEVATHEAFAQQISGEVGRAQQKIKELHDATATSDAARTELAQRVSEAAHAIWGRLPVLETQLSAESEARETSAKQTSEDLQRLEQRLNLQSGESKETLDQLQTANAAIDAGAGQIGRAETRISQLALASEKQRHELLTQAHRVSVFLREVRSSLPNKLSEEQVARVTETLDNAVMPLYAEFADVFRGPREEVKQRLKIYLPRLEQIKGPLLDLGCGRGEWLELLSEHQLTGRGVDANASMIGRCHALGLDVVKADALAHLQSLPDKSLGAITSFHLIEHLPFETVVAMVCEALRVLQNGGVLILETPNPQNALVGSQTFWVDPTRKHPIPSETLRFFVEAHGFCDVEVVHLEPFPETVRVPEGCGELARRFNDYFYGPQAYSVIARRP